MYTPYSVWAQKLNKITDDQESAEMIKKIFTLKQVLLSSGLTNADHKDIFESAYNKAIFSDTSSSKKAMESIAAQAQNCVNIYYGQK